MTTIDKEKKTGAERAVAAKTPDEGPHTSRGRKNAKALAATGGDGEPAYVVAVTARPSDNDGAPKEKLVYSPEELRAKATSLLKSGRLSAEEKSVLEDILGLDSPQKQK